VKAKKVQLWGVQSEEMYVSFKEARSYRMVGEEIGQPRQVSKKVKREGKKGARWVKNFCFGDGGGDPPITGASHQG